MPCPLPMSWGNVWADRSVQCMDRRPHREERARLIETSPQLAKSLRLIIQALLILCGQNYGLCALERAGY